MSAIARSTVDWPARLAYEAGCNEVADASV